MNRYDFNNGSCALCTSVEELLMLPQVESRRARARAFFIPLENQYIPRYLFFPRRLQARIQYFPDECQIQNALPDENSGVDDLYTLLGNSNEIRTSLRKAARSFFDNVAECVDSKGKNEEFPRDQKSATCPRYLK